MSTLDTHSLPWQQVYARLTEIIQPRPIALVSTQDAEGRLNLAPFSFFNLISCNPPLIAFAPQISGRTGQKKDTLRNIEQHPEFVVATVTEAIAERVNQASAPYDYGVSEFEKTGLTPVPAQKVRGFCVAESPVNLECSLLEIRSYGEGGGAGHLVVARVELLHIDDSLQDEAGCILPERLQAVGRMGGEDWCTTRDRFAYPRPDRR